MNCQFVLEQIIANSGRQPLASDVETHLWTCQSCSKVYLEQQALWRKLDAWDAPEISPGFDNRLFARIGGRRPWAGLGWLFRPLQPAFPAALACMLLIAAMVVEHGRRVPLPAKRVVVSQTEEVKQIETALDDIQMLSEFEILPLEQSGEGKS